MRYPKIKENSNLAEISQTSSVPDVDVPPWRFRYTTYIPAKPFYRLIYLLPSVPDIRLAQTSQPEPQPLDPEADKRSNVRHATKVAPSYQKHIIRLKPVPFSVRRSIPYSESFDETLSPDPALRIVLDPSAFATMLLSVLVFFVTPFLAQARSLTPLAAKKYTVKCHRVPTTPLDRVDCTYFLQTLRTTPWANAPVTYGRQEPPPGTTPIRIDSHSCHFELMTLAERTMVTDTFQLSDYFDALDAIRDTCLSPAGMARGYTMGITLLGDKGEFFAYLGGSPTNYLLLGNRTSFPGGAG